MRAVVCDLDGVVRHFDVAALADIERTCGLAEGAANLALSLRRLGLLDESAQLPSGNPPR